MLDERHNHREQLVYNLRVFDAETGSVRGYVNNISPDGLMLLSASPIPLHARMKLRMELPEPIEGRREILFEVINAWTTNDDRMDFYDAGFRFEPLTAKDRECIARLMCDYGLDEDLH